MGNELDLSG